MDEVGFQVGYGKGRIVFTYEPDLTGLIPSKTSRESITIIEAINTTGNSIAPFIILPIQSIYASFAANTLSDDTVIQPSREGYTTDIIGFEWMQHFERLTQSRYVKKGGSASTAYG